MSDTASLIGVAIACAGNVLISLALTVQKLAHKKQERDALSALGLTAHPIPPLPAEIPPERRLSATSARSLSPTFRHFDRAEAPTYRNYDRAEADWLAHAHGNARLGDSPVAVQVELADGVDGLDGAQSPPAVNEGDYLRSKLWWLGLGMMAVGEGGNFVSYGFAPASVVAPLGTVALIANCVFAPLILGEKFTKRNVLGVALAILGAVTVVWSGRGSNPRLSPHELIAAILAPPFLALTAVTATLIGAGAYLSDRPFGSQHVVVDVGTCALFGGYTVMATKALSSLISASPLTALKEPVAWAAIVVLVVTSVLQIKFLNRALMRFESKVVIPTQFVFFSMSAIIGSAVLYQEFRETTFSQFVNFAFGIATTFLGVYFLTTPGEAPLEEIIPVGTPAQRVPLSPVAEENTPLLRSSMSDTRRMSVPLTGRMSKRASQSNIALGVSSQGGLLLLASTPPVSPATPLTRRERASSRSSITSDGTGNGHVWPSIESVLPSVTRR